MAGSEGENIERIPSCDLTDARDRLVLVREVASLLNSGGGTILIGVRKGGQVVGLSSDDAGTFDAGAIGDLVNGFLDPDRIEITVTATEQTDGTVIVEIAVPAIADPPVVLGRAGTYTDRAGEENIVFAPNMIVTRHNNRMVAAARQDHQQWRADALEAIRRGLSERLAMVIAAPPEARVRVVTADEVRDEPSYFLSRSTELFSLQNDQLLSSQDLLYLWLHRETLQIAGDGAELIIQSALRKRATLYLWLAILPLGAQEIRAYLWRSLEMKDRDKSDAARAMLFVCALYLRAEDYAKLVSALSESSYTHMREAAESLPDIDQARAQLRGERLIGSGQEQLVKEPDLYLFRHADELLRRDGTGSRRVPSLGLELLNRKLERRHADLLDQPTPN